MKAARVNAGYSQEAIAEKMGVIRGTVHNWETGKTDPSVPAFKMFCELCGLTEDDVFLPNNSTKSR